MEKVNEKLGKEPIDVERIVEIIANNPEFKPYMQPEALDFIVKSIKEGISNLEIQNGDSVNVATTNEENGENEKSVDKNNIIIGNFGDKNDVEDEIEKTDINGVIAQINEGLKEVKDGTKVEAKDGTKVEAKVNFNPPDRILKFTSAPTPASTSTSTPIRKKGDSA